MITNHLMLYYLAGSCALAPHIALEHSGLAYEAILNTDATLFQEFCDRFSKYGDKMLTLFADGQAVEIPVFF